jgi:hypothetical protein
MTLVSVPTTLGIDTPYHCWSDAVLFIILSMVEWVQGHLLFIMTAFAIMTAIASSLFSKELEQEYGFHTPPRPTRTHEVPKGPSRKRPGRAINRANRLRPKALFVDDDAATDMSRYDEEQVLPTDSSAE